jgi:hypothetical protein
MVSALALALARVPKKGNFLKSPLCNALPAALYGVQEGRCLYSTGTLVREAAGAPVRRRLSTFHNDRRKIKEAEMASKPVNYCFHRCITSLNSSSPSDKNFRYYMFRPREFLKDYGKVGFGVYTSIYLTTFGAAFAVLYFDVINLVHYGYDPESILCSVSVSIHIIVPGHRS